MKLSEVKGEKALDMFADLIEPVTEIIDDKEISEILKRRDKNAGIKATLGKAASKAIKNHKKAVIRILATLDDVPVEKYECTIMSLPKKLLDILNDPAIFELFTLQSQETPIPSGSATANIVESEN